ncbi:hypothetical protein HCN44_003334 [Aphidius gifuensis]|uniref:Uncharacterized protein n=1 Tax=Aphidius gifuensis TaxID=684658 RepID=A0A835CRS9_APHGI|nr:hypothetical protein HCN44_003334 [Aphidius gifuensis]
MKILRPWFGRIFLMENLILPPKFSTKFNGETVKAKSNKIIAEEEEEIFNFGEWNVTLDGGKWKLKKKDSGET